MLVSESVYTILQLSIGTDKDYCAKYPNVNIAAALC